MEHLTPAELLRFLEEEGNTLQSINAKISNQIHLLQVEEELFNRKLKKLEKKSASTLLIEYGQSEQDAYDNLNTGEVENDVQRERRDEDPVLLIGYDEQAPESSPTVRQSPVQGIAIRSEELEQHSRTLAESTEQALESRPAPQLTPGSQNGSVGDGQELVQITGLQNDEGKQRAGAPDPQEMRRVKEKSRPQRSSGRRTSRRPTRFLD